jgi:hypothetical protein
VTSALSLALPEVQPVAAPHLSTGAPRKVLFSAMKNEAPFVLEWIAYHKVIGFDEIVICSNPSNDGMEEILSALADAGEIRHLRATVPPDERPQSVASDAFAAEVGYRRDDWYLWLDADEFLNVHVGDRTVHALVDALQDRQFALINWRLFGAAGHDRFPGRFIDQGFVRAAEADFPANLQQKTLFRYDDAVVGFGRIGIHRPVLQPGSDLTAAAVVTGSGGAANAVGRTNRNWLRGSDIPTNAFVSKAEAGWTLAQINHYCVRTPEFFVLKRLRGRGFEPNAVGRSNTRHINTFFTGHDRNEAEDRSILHWEARVTDEIARLMRLPSVAAAKRRSDGLVKVLLSEIGADGGRSSPGWMKLPVAAPKVPQPKVTEAPPAFPLDLRPREADLLRRCLDAASVVLAYGNAGATVLAAERGLKVNCVENDRDRAKRLTECLYPFPDAKVVHVDIGPTAAEGMPSRPRFHGRFHLYPLSVWDSPDLGDPDLVLIDGRFRAACLAAVMLRAKRPTTVLFHDYADRSDYHRVEHLARKEETVARLARFTVTPGAIPPEMLTDVIGWFSDAR